MDNDLTLRAEQAALGAMIADHLLFSRLAYLEPEDFTDPRYRLVFRAIRQLSASMPFGRGSQRDLIAKTAGRWVSRRYLDELAAACPDPAHGPAYGAMLVQAAVYRRARGHADQMDAQAAAIRADGSRLGRAGASEAARAAADAGALLAETARAIRRHTSPLAPPPPDQGPRHGLTPAEPTGQRPVTSAEQREELVLSAVLREHSEAWQILSYLHTAAFTSPDRQEIFRAARRLSNSGRPVDELTVSWELATRSAVNAVLSPDSAPGTQSLDSYIRRLASTSGHAGFSPLRAAHYLDAQLWYRAYPVTESAGRTASSPASGHQGQAPEPGAVRALGAPAAAGAVPLVRPQDPAGARPTGPEPGR